MIKNTIYLLLTFLLFFACNQPKNNAVDELISLEEFMSVAVDNVDAQVTVSGMVNHVCSHSGRRCFIVDSTGQISVRVEAAGEIENFGKELIGSKIKVDGLIKEVRLMADEIDEMEQEHIAEHPDEAEATGEHCSAEMANINKMREWMKVNGKNYYSIFYIDGLSYELVQ
ncbi:MAG: OB-fold nucleic acid binding domain-containing protein [Prolixibacteraceae bacterium]|nr:OB-fold nucleic acid binding domain-containing protein [Prolixibacteraceae bacterium]